MIQAVKKCSITRRGFENIIWHGLKRKIAANKARVCEVLGKSAVLQGHLPPSSSFPINHPPFLPVTPCLLLAPSHLGTLAAQNVITHCVQHSIQFPFNRVMRGDGKFAYRPDTVGILYLHHFYPLQAFSSCGGMSCQVCTRPERQYEPQIGLKATAEQAVREAAYQKIWRSLHWKHCISE